MKREMHGMGMRSDVAPIHAHNKNDSKPNVIGLLSIIHKKILNEYNIITL